IASLLEVGTGFHPELTGRENIYLNGAILGMTRAEITAKLDEIVEFSGCEMYIDTPTKRYSSGMTVRLAFAVAAHLEPDILVVDEVLAVGDAEFQKKAIGKMQDISKGDGRTVLFVSHNMAAVKNLCTRTIVLEYGKVVYGGTAEECVDYYLKKNVDTSHIDIALGQRKDRIGGKDFRYINVKLLNNKDQEIDNCISGEYLKIQIFYKSKRNFDANRFIFGFTILDSQENLITGLSSVETGLRIEKIEATGIITWEIPKLLLRADQYFLRLFASYETAEPKNFLDVIENAIEINVLPGDFWDKAIVNRRGTDMILPSTIY
ncbi:MAG: ABC transporter ATP-binding protein, partial [Pusillimonas sp.]|nr:ABC transporter ATP-binding protein [Pusillimonas sp.]